MMTKGQKRIGGRSSNIKGSDNIISNGSGIAVADGQCMIIVDQGKVVEVCAEPENLHMILLRSPVYLPVHWDRAFWTPLRLSKAFYLRRRYGKRPESVLLQYKRASRQ